MPEAKPSEWVDALQEVISLAPWVLGLIAVVVVVRYALVPLIRAWKGKQGDN